MSKECLSQLQVAEKLGYTQTMGFTNELATKIDCRKMGADIEKLDKYSSDYDCPADDDIIKEDKLLKPMTSYSYIGTIIAESPIMSTTTNNSIAVRLGKKANNVCPIEILFEVPAFPSSVIVVQGDYFMTNGQVGFNQVVINNRPSSQLPEGMAYLDKRGGAISYRFIDTITNELYQGRIQNLMIET